MTFQKSEGGNKPSEISNEALDHEVKPKMGIKRLIKIFLPIFIIFGLFLCYLFGESWQLFLVNLNPNSIKYLPRPSEKIQLAAIEKKPSILKDISSPSDALLLAAVRQNPTDLQYIKNQSELLQMTAVEQLPIMIKDAMNPDPTEAVQLAAIRNDLNAFDSIKKPTPRVVRLKNIMVQINKDPSSMGQYLNLDNEDLKELVIENPYIVQYIASPGEDLQLAAIEKNYKVAKLIPNLSESAKERSSAIEEENAVKIDNCLKDKNIWGGSWPHDASMPPGELSVSFKDYITKDQGKNLLQTFKLSIGEEGWFGEVVYVGSENERNWYCKLSVEPEIHLVGPNRLMMPASL